MSKKHPIPYGYVYRITSILTGETYIGQRRLSADQGRSWRYYMGSGVRVRRSIAKYGIENFTKAFVGYAFTKNDLDHLEVTTMIKEREEGHAEYNIHFGSPSFPYFDTYTRMSDDEKNNVNSRRVEKARLRSELRYSKFVETHGSKVVELYSELGSVKKVAKVLDVYPSLVKRYLLSSGISIQDRTKKGYIRTPEEKAKISEALRLKAGDRARIEQWVVCVRCSVPFRGLKDRQFCGQPCIGAHASKVYSSSNNRPINRHAKEDLEKLQRLGLGVMEIATELNCSKSTVYRLLYKHGLK